MKFKHPYQIPSSEIRDDIRLLPLSEKGVDYKFCFVLLNPFYKRKNNDKGNIEVKQKWVEGLRSDIRNRYEVYCWSDLLKNSGISDIKEIFHCLYAYNGSFAERYKTVNKQTWESFNKVISQERLLSNSESNLSALLVDPILNALKKLGYNKVAIYDVYPQEIEFTDINDLLKSDSEFPFEFRLLTEDRKLLLYQEYEHYETFIYSTDLKLLNRFLDLVNLEGFMANETTTLLWNEIEIDENAETIKL